MKEIAQVIVLMTMMLYSFACVPETREPTGGGIVTEGGPDVPAEIEESEDPPGGSMTPGDGYALDAVRQPTSVDYALECFAQLPPCSYVPPSGPFESQGDCYTAHRITYKYYYGCCQWCPGWTAQQRSQCRQRVTAEYHAEINLTCLNWVPALSVIDCQNDDNSGVTSCQYEPVPWIGWATAQYCIDYGARPELAECLWCCGTCGDVSSGGDGNILQCANNCFDSFTMNLHDCCPLPGLLPRECE